MKTRIKNLTQRATMPAIDDASAQRDVILKVFGIRISLQTRTDSRLFSPLIAPGMMREAAHRNARTYLKRRSTRGRFSAAVP